MLTLEGAISQIRLGSHHSVTVVRKRRGAVKNGAEVKEIHVPRRIKYGLDCMFLRLNWTCDDPCVMMVEFERVNSQQNAVKTVCYMRNVMVDNEY